MTIVNAKKTLNSSPTEDTKETLSRPEEKRRRGLFPSAVLGYQSLGPCRRRLAFCSSR
mgnify:CR=1 FL=1